MLQRGLALHPEKTRIVHINDGFNFLGFSVKRYGGRKLGIPSVIDRFIQQAVLQVLQGKWDSTFSEHSYGFRPKRLAHQAIGKAQEYIQSGYAYVVDFDLEKFFDRVNHDILMSQVAKRVEDK